MLKINSFSMSDEVAQMNFHLFVYFSLLVKWVSIIPRDANKIQQNLQLISQVSMNSQNLRIGVAVTLLLSLVAIIPHLFASIAHQHEVKPTPLHSLDSAFLPISASVDLEAKANELAERIKNIKQGSACTGPNDNVCENLKNQYKRLITDADIALQKQVNQRMIYESKWNTTCQEWKGESQRLRNITIDLAYELKNNSIKIEAMSNQISQLETKKNNIPSCSKCEVCKEKTCPICPEGGQTDCPVPVPCPQCEESCPVCYECQECPHCYDEDYNQLQNLYTILTHKFQECEALVEDHRNNPIEPEDCSAIQDQLNQNLRDGLNSLNTKLQSASLGSEFLRQAIKRAERQLESSKSVQDSISVVPLILNSLTKQLHDLQAKSKQQGSGGKPCEKCGESQTQILDECMSSFKRAVDKLKFCEKSLSPFLAGNKQ